MDYALDLIQIGSGINGNGTNPELVASLNINSDSTIGNVVSAARNVLGVEPSTYFKELLDRQLQANVNYQSTASKDLELLQSYGFSVRN
jgi:hypothetical protein